MADQTTKSENDDPLGGALVLAIATVAGLLVVVLLIAWRAAPYFAGQTWPYFSMRWGWLRGSLIVSVALLTAVFFSLVTYDYGLRLVADPSWEALISTLLAVWAVEAALAPLVASFRIYRLRRTLERQPDAVQRRVRRGFTRAQELSARRDLKRS